MDPLSAKLLHAFLSANESLLFLAIILNEKVDLIIEDRPPSEARMQVRDHKTLFKVPRSYVNLFVLVIGS